MILQKFVVGPLETNSYIFGDESAKEVILIDPGGEPAVISDFIKKNSLSLKYIINTHGHGDHIAANPHFKADVLIHKLDADFLTNAALNLSPAFGYKISVPQASRLLDDGEKVRVGKLSLEVIHTPGHTPGSICLKYDNILFSGDTLFFESIGRTDIPNASPEAILESIRSKLMTLPDECEVYPGHGRETSIGHEKEHNPFL